MCLVYEALRSQTFWTAVSAIALIVTLIWIAMYTQATTRMADATKSMAEAQRELTALQRRPVVVVGCANEEVFRFRTLFKNFSFVHAKAKVKATIVINGKLLTLPLGHYDRTKTWHIQAVGPFGPEFEGHLSFDEVFKLNEMDFPAESTVDAHVTLEAWVINYNDPESELDRDENRNPIVHWDWKGRWVPEIAPMLGVK
jgi:hypothetical protein